MKLQSFKGGIRTGFWWRMSHLNDKWKDHFRSFSGPRLSHEELIAATNMNFMGGEPYHFDRSEYENL